VNEAERVVTEKGGGISALFAFCFGAVGAVVILCLVFVWSYGFSRPVAGDMEAVVYIEKGSSLANIRHTLAGAGIIDNDRRFELLTMFMGVSGRLKAGEYRILPGTTPYEIIRRLTKGDQFYRRVTIPEGATIYQVARLVAAQHFCEEGEFLALLKDKTFIRELGIEASSLEGYLFPETYSFARGVAAKEIIIHMVNKGNDIWESVLANNPSTDLPFSRHQILTLASIVERETAVDTERPMVAQVLLERLRRKMRLQVDPTVYYGLRKESGKLSRKDLRAQNRYNTYVIDGLPLGPIANPGRASIESVLAPASTSYLYFVSQNDGTHHFSKTLKEHNRAVKKYRKGQ